MLDELRQIAIFAKTVDHGSFRAAARELQLSPSVVSHHVGQLEQRLGTALLYRSTRKLSLTPDGERLLESARTMIEAAETGMQVMSGQSNELSGRVRITVPALFSESALMDQLTEFCIHHPRVELSLDLSETRRNIIADGFDIAIRAGIMEDSSLKSQKLFQFNRRLVGSPVYVKTRPKPEKPTDLNDWNWIELAPVRHVKNEFRKGRKRQTVQKGKPQISVNNALGLSQLARAGAGLAVVPEFMAEPHISANTLEYVLSDWTVDPISVYAVWPSNAPRDGLIRQLVKFLKTQQQS